MIERFSPVKRATLDRNISADILNSLRYSLLFIFILTIPAMASDWFRHTFGELRAYHEHWLAVCAQEGDGACRAVQYEADPDSFAIFDERIAVHRIDGTPDWQIELMDRGMPETINTLIFTIDGKVMAASPQQWRMGAIDYLNVAETLLITDPNLNNQLLEQMRAGNRLTVQYAPKGSGNGKSVFSLIGFTSATNAINARILARQE